MITMTYLGAILTLCCYGFLAFWFGYFVACLMASAARRDEQMGLR